LARRLLRGKDYAPISPPATSVPGGFAAAKPPATSVPGGFAAGSYLPKEKTPQP